jgi:hypothetical protein
VLTSGNVSLWITAFRREQALADTVRGWLESFPFDTVNVISNDPAWDYFDICAAFPEVKVWPNMFREGWETGSIAWCWNQAMRHTFLDRGWCLMSQDDVEVLPGWDKLITPAYDTYIAPVGDVVMLQSLAGFGRTGWFDERFRAIGGPEADYALRTLHAGPDRCSIHDEHGWQWRHNDVGLAAHWRSQIRTGEILETRNAYNAPYADAECFARWEQKWGVPVDHLMTVPHQALRRPGWDEIDWYPSFTRRLREAGRLR